jgi:hypothetical protein
MPPGATGTIQDSLDAMLGKERAKELDYERVVFIEPARCQVVPSSKAFVKISVRQSHSPVFLRSSSNLPLNRSGVFRPIAPHHEDCPKDDRQAHDDPHRCAACLGYR